MNRHGYLSEAGGRNEYLKEKRNISISPSRFQPKSQPALRRRKQLVLRLIGLVAAVICFVSLFFPSLRSTLLATLSVGLFEEHVETLQIETVRYYDLSESVGTDRGWERGERVLMCAPLRDAESHLPMFFSHLRNFTYPHRSIDLAFLVSDSKDNTLNLLTTLLNELQNDPDPKQPYGEISVIKKDFGQKVNQDVESRHGFAAQASRRKLMAQARNWLLSAALRPTHSWVYWRDVDVETAPFTILEDLMRHDKDVIVPNVWRPLPDWLGGEQPYDLNSWQESESALALADTLDEDAVIVEGYAEYATWRPHLAYLRDPYGDPDMEMELDGVGGVSILAKARVFRAGVHFPAFSFQKHAETEGFGKMAKRMRFSIVGLPHYTVWHLYEPSVDDIRHMEEMEAERRNHEKEEREKAERAKKIKEEFGDANSQWEQDKSLMKEMSNEQQIKKEHEGAVAAQNKEKSKEGDDGKEKSKGKDKVKEGDDGKTKEKDTGRGKNDGKDGDKDRDQGTKKSDSVDGDKQKDAKKPVDETKGSKLKDGAESKDSRISKDEKPLRSSKEGSADVNDKSEKGTERKQDDSEASNTKKKASLAADDKDRKSNKDGDDRKAAIEETGSDEPKKKSSKDLNTEDSPKGKLSKISDPDSSPGDSTRVGKSAGEKDESRASFKGKSEDEKSSSSSKGKKSEKDSGKPKNDDEK